MNTCTTPDCFRVTTLYLCTECIVELDDLLEDVPDLCRLLDGPISQTSVTRNPGSTGGGGGHYGSKPAMDVDAWLLRAWLNQLPGRAYNAAVDNPEAGYTLFMARIWVTQARELVWGQEDTRVYGMCGAPVDPEACPECEGPVEFGMCTVCEVPVGQVECPAPLTANAADDSVKCAGCGEVHIVSDLLEQLREKARGRPMAPREAREYLHKHAKVTILKKDFENWVRLGRLGYVLDHVNTEGKAQRIYYPGDVLEVFEYMRGRKRVAA